MTPGQRLRAYRTEAKFSQAAFAKIAGISRSYLSDIERDKTKVSADVANQIFLAVHGLDPDIPYDELADALAGLRAPVADDANPAPPPRTRRIHGRTRPARGA